MVIPDLPGRKRLLRRPQHVQGVPEYVPRLNHGLGLRRRTAKRPHAVGLHALGLPPLSRVGVGPAASVRGV